MWNNKVTFVKTSMARLSHSHNSRKQIKLLTYCILLKEKRPFFCFQISISEPDMTWPVLTWDMHKHESATAIQLLLFAFIFPRVLSSDCKFHGTAESTLGQIFRLHLRNLILSFGPVSLVFFFHQDRDHSTYFGRYILQVLFGSLSDWIAPIRTASIPARVTLCWTARLTYTAVNIVSWCVALLLNLKKN